MCGVLIQGTPFLVEQIFTDKYWLDTETDRQMSAVKWAVVRCPMYLVRLPNRQMTTWSMGHLVIWWLKQVHYTSHNSHLTADIWPGRCPARTLWNTFSSQRRNRSPQPTLPSAAFTRSGVNGIW